MKRFNLGRVTMTMRVYVDMKEEETFEAQVQQALEDHPNKYAVIDGNKITSSIITCAGEILIITELDRKVTTILYPDEEGGFSEEEKDLIEKIRKNLNRLGLNAHYCDDFDVMRKEINIVADAKGDFEDHLKKGIILEKYLTFDI